MADLYEIARLRLSAAGVSRISGGQLCTFCEPQRFYSYRRDGATGRFADDGPRRFIETARVFAEFTLPDIVNEHPDRIAYLMEVVQNGVEQVYDHEEVPGSLQRLHYSIDGQDVQFNPAYSRAGSIIVVKMKKV